MKELDAGTSMGEGCGGKGGHLAHRRGIDRMWIIAPLARMSQDREASGAPTYCLTTTALISAKASVTELLP